MHCRGLWGPRLLCHEEAGLFKTSILRIFTSSKASLSKVHHMLTCSRKRGCCPSCRCCFSSCPTSIIDPLSLVFMQMCCRQLLPPAQVHASRCQVNFLTYLLIFLPCLVCSKMAILLISSFPRTTSARCRAATPWSTGRTCASRGSVSQQDRPPKHSHIEPPNWTRSPAKHD